MTLGHILATITIGFATATPVFLSITKEAKPLDDAPISRAEENLHQVEQKNQAARHIKPHLVYRGNNIFTLSEPYGATIVSQDKLPTTGPVEMATIVTAKKGAADPEIPGRPCLGEIWGKTVQLGRTTIRLVKVSQSLGDGAPVIGQKAFYSLEAAIDGPLPRRGGIDTWSAK